MSKSQRSHELMTPRDIDKIHQLYRKFHVEVCLIAERYSVEDSVIKEILARKHSPRESRWKVRWHDTEGESHTATWETFRAAKLYAAQLTGADWVRVERC